MTRAAWAGWQAGLTQPFTLPADLPPLRALLVWDNLTGHKTPELVCWLCAHGVMPLYTPLGGSWLNMAESIQRILVRRALDGQHPENIQDLKNWLTATVRAWNTATTPFAWGGDAPRGASALVHDATPWAAPAGIRAGLFAAVLTARASRTNGYHHAK